ncbi:hypothetical protein FHG87_020624 [Trinorchestia longiramus]|nr:hypothetical protein FHG87_020624 [Trinorchestia longiramus]
MVEVDSWTTGSEFAAQILHARGIETNSSGWSVALSEHDSLHELPGEEYVLDLVCVRELPPAFPARASSALYSGPSPDGVYGDGSSTEARNGFTESPVIARRSDKRL